MTYLLSGSMYPSNQAPGVNYPQGDYRTISKLDRQRAEMAKNARLEAELARERQWKDLEFQKRLMELQKNLFGGGGVSSSSQPAASLQTPANVRTAPEGPRGSGAGGFMTSGDRMFEDNPLMKAMFQNQRATQMFSDPAFRMLNSMPPIGPADTPYTAQFGTLGDPEKQKLWQQWMMALMGRGGGK